jgi:hypothetical protein
MGIRDSLKKQKMIKEKQTVGIKSISGWSGLK